MGKCSPSPSPSTCADVASEALDLGARRRFGRAGDPRDRLRARTPVRAPRGAGAQPARPGRRGAPRRQHAGGRRDRLRRPLAGRARSARAAPARGPPGSCAATAATGAARRPRRDALLRDVVRVRDARVDDPLARGARLARPLVPARAGSPGRDPDPRGALARRRRGARSRRAPARMGAAPLRAARRRDRSPRRPCPEGARDRSDIPTAVLCWPTARAALRRFTIPVPCISS